MKREYLVRGILATLFAIFLLIGLFFGIKYLLKPDCSKKPFSSLESIPQCISINPSCENNKIEISNNCESDFLITDYNFNSDSNEIEYIDNSGSIKNLLITLSKNNPDCNYNIELTIPKTEEDIIKMNCKNLLIMKTHITTITNINKDFQITSNNLQIKGSL